MRVGGHWRMEEVPQLQEGVVVLVLGHLKFDLIRLYWKEKCVRVRCWKIYKRRQEREASLLHLLLHLLQNHFSAVRKSVKAFWGRLRLCLLFFSLGIRERTGTGRQSYLKFGRRPGYATIRLPCHHRL